MACLSAGSRNSFLVASDSGRTPQASHRRSAIVAAMAAKAPSGGASPSSSTTPAASAKLCPVDSMRDTRPLSSRQISRAPTSSAVRSSILPSMQTAILLVPPPMSMFITRASGSSEAATAPEPWAASVVSSPSPAATATKRPAWAANNAPTAAALRRPAATPVRIRAPVSIMSGVMPAAVYCALMKRPKAAASMLRSSL